MGACGFQTGPVKGDSMADAYQRAVSDALSEYGHDPYNGSISTTEGAILAIRQTMTTKGASHYAELDTGNCHKWGAAKAIPVAGDGHFTFTKVKLTVTLPPTRPHLDWDDRPTGRTVQTSEWDLREAAQKKVFAQYQAHMVHDIAIVPKMKVKTVVEPAKGKSVTRYELTSVGAGFRKLYTTRAEAVRAAKEALKQGLSSRKVGVRAVRYWPESDTTEAVTVRNETVSATAEVTVTLAHAKGVVAAQAWTFYGMAAE